MPIKQKQRDVSGWYTWACFPVLGFGFCQEMATKYTKK
jgi:hypothetical protein